ncbi:MAG: hypothetical protein M0R06_21670 [Sphaerochaeta sp.]|nr:hypothetical protein [Sphaerochaeta sp.]
MTYTEHDLEPMARDSLIRIILRLQTDMEANEREYDALREEIRYARAVAQSWDDCRGWDPSWCPTSCKWWKLCQPMEERCDSSSVS